MGLNRRRYLATVGATVSALGLTGCTGGDSTENSDDGNGSSGESDVSAQWNYKEYSEVRFPSQSEGVSFESDDETQYVGVQLEVTNEMNESANLIYLQTAPEVTLFADGSSDDVSVHNQSDFSSLESVGAGETVEATLLYTTPPEASSYTLETREDSEHTYDISRDENLDIGLVDLSSS
ncbi:DUF4352 domain-containing protein [Salinibaculum rarum]|uniref:DUF4352 domain-containing protein n=1 Tax=Salinibaculum rarum TaxID=3058903 RepID=UPI00265E3BDA|nr:DUF4352 domain-containing protein [Salinibaculum sp. KK48]